MKTKRFSHLCTVLVLVLLASLAIGRGPASRAADASGPQGQTGTVFTYQGQLRDGNGPVNGICDLRFTLWDAAEGGSQLGSPLTLEAIELKDGLFTARLDFGAAAFRGQVRWLAVAASCPTGGAYVDLAPRQELTASPYAVWALGAPWAGLAGVPADLLDGDQDTTYGAGAGLTLSNGQFSVSFAGSGTATTASRSDHQHDSAYVNEGQANSVSTGMVQNSTLLLEDLNQNGCGTGQVIKWTGSAWACAPDQTGTGSYWSLSGNAGTTPGTNYLGTSDNLALELKVNGVRALRLEPAAIPNVLGGYEGNQVTAPAMGATIGGGGSGGIANRVTDSWGTVGGGANNRAGDDMGTTYDGGFATVGGGQHNTSGGYGATVSGGISNSASGFGASVGGGYTNTASLTYSTVGGGVDNSASSDCSTVGGGWNNAASAEYSAIAGGEGNRASGWGSAVGGGDDNRATALEATIGGGGLNMATDERATVAGGFNNRAGDAAGTVTDRPFATVGGGRDNIASGTSSVVAGGDTNTASGWRSMVPGGAGNVASGEHTFAAGRRAQALHNGSFVWADAHDEDFVSDAANEFLVRAYNGVKIVRGASTYSASQAALQVDQAAAAEAGWFYTMHASNAFAVLKVAKDPSAPGNFVDGVDRTSGGAETRRFHIDKDGTYVAGSDFAEALPVTGDPATYDPGDVLVVSFERPGGVEKCRQPYDGLVVGVYSTRPGFLGADKDGSTEVYADEVPVAVLGIVPVKVTDENGPIQPGDLLTTSSTPGHAMRCEGLEPCFGRTLGKALEGLPAGEHSGVIRVLVSLQ